MFEKQIQDILKTAKPTLSNLRSTFEHQFRVTQINTIGFLSRDLIGSKAL
jgi:hypothetical protein